MKTKIFIAGALALALGFFVTSCEDDEEYSIATGQIVTSYSTGSADVTANSATLYGTVTGLEDTDASFYTVGFYYGTSSDDLSSKITGSLDDTTVSAEVTGLSDGTTYYYQVFVTLSSTVTYTGGVSSFVTTDATVTTVSASSVGSFGATVGGKITGAPDGTTCGIVISTSDDTETVREGLIVEYGDATDSYTLEEKGLLPNTTYYYAAYLDLGSGVVYGSVESFTTDDHSLDASEDFVDLGLSTNWCKFNLGTDSEAEYGGYFAFAEFTGVFNETDSDNLEIAEDVYQTANDIVYRTYGATAMLPSAEEFEELFTCCTSEWTTQDDVEGLLLTGPNGNTLFLPAAGYRTGNTLNEEGTTGLYFTGSVNASNTDFAQSYGFNASYNERTTTPRFYCLSIRPVSTAKSVALDLSNLYQTWYLDIDADGNTHYWDGPIYYYGTEDSWATITNGEYSFGDSWAWEPAYSENTWICTAADYGSMTFAEDGTVTVTVDGVTSTGTFTVDTENKTISLEGDGVEVISCGYESVCTNRTTELPIFSLNEYGMQIGLLRDNSDEGECYLSHNFYSDTQLASESIDVTLLCVDGNWGGTWGTVVETINTSELKSTGSYTSTVTYEGSIASAMVFTLDFGSMTTWFPNALVRIDDISCDGESIEFDGSKFYYGDIEDNGNYRVELFNIWGKGASNSVVVDSPFSSATDVASDEAFSCDSYFTITYTIITDASSILSTDIYPTLITITPSWAGNWSYSESDDYFQIVYEDYQYKLSGADFDMTISSTEQGVDYSDGSIMTFAQISNIYYYFPCTHGVVDELLLDGTALTGYDESLILDVNGDGDGYTYRLELWNMYGTTSSSGCAFGTATDGVISELGFSDTMELKFSLESLYTIPSWEE